MNRENSANTDLEFHVHDTREWLASYNLDSFTAQSVQLVVVRAGLQERTLSELQQSSNMHTTLSTGVLCVCVLCVLATVSILRLCLTAAFSYRRLLFHHYSITFNGLTMLVGRQEGHPDYKNLAVGMSVVTIWLDLCTAYSSSCHHNFHHP